MVATAIAAVSVALRRGHIAAEEKVDAEISVRRSNVTVDGIMIVMGDDHMAFQSSGLL